MFCIFRGLMVSIINFGPLYNDPEQGRQWWRGAVAVVTVLITSHIVRIMTRTSHTANTGNWGIFSSKLHEYYGHNLYQS